MTTFDPTIVSSRINDANQDLRSAKPIYHPSPFWLDLKTVHEKQLLSESISSFKRTVNFRYFNWGLLGIIYHQLFGLLVHRFKNLNKKMNYGSLVNNNKCFSPLVAWLYSLYVSLLWFYVQNNDQGNICNAIEEPDIGAPLTITVNGKKISQDLANSIHEFYSATGAYDDLTSLNEIRNSPREVLEIGAGYGRLGYVFLKVLPACNYTIVDIPPALQIAESYLSSIFPEDQVFRYRPFSNFKEVKEEFLASRIRFILAPQIELLPEKLFDNVINISSFHEMTSDQVAFYFKEIERICSSSFYTKQWLRSRTPENGTRFYWNTYPVPAGWKTHFIRKHPIQRSFFEALYEVRS